MGILICFSRYKYSYLLFPYHFYPFYPLIFMFNPLRFLAVRVLQGMAFAGDMATFGHFVTYWTYHKQYAFFTATLCVYVQLAPIFTNPVSGNNPPISNPNFGAFSPSGILCESSFGWPGVYYFHAIVTLVLFTLFFLCYRNDPNKHPMVNDVEREKIARGRDSLDAQAQKHLPYM